MYCENCGAPVAEGYRYCPSCGKPFAVAVMRAPRRSRVQEHVQLVGILWIAAGVLLLLAALTVVGVGRALLGFLPGAELPAAVLPLMHAIFTFAALLVGAKGAADVLAGWGLLERASWARPLAIVLSFLALLSIPVGTALGIYSLWVLLPEESAREYDQLAQAA
jgi:zinc-ribbon domain